MAVRREGVRVLIVGAGIGGLTAAIALRRVGADPLVIERLPSERGLQLGAGLHLWSNAAQALREIDLAEAVADLGTRMRTQRYLDWRGRSLGSFDVAAISERLGGPTVGVARPALHRLLLDTLDGTELRLGASCVGFEQGGRDVTVRFADGSEERGEVLVGADGIDSVVRRQLHGPHPRVYAGYTAWRALCDFAHPRVPVGEMWIHWGRGARILHYHVGEQLYWLALARAPEGGTDPPGGRRRAVLERYRGWSEPIEAMIAATDEDAIFRTDITDRDPIRHWGTGRVTLLGDAAHPMSPNMAQGAGQAIEDAVALARALRDSSDPVAGLRAYEQRRVDRANALLTTSRTVGRLSLATSPLVCALRDHVALRTVYGSYARTKAERDLTASI